MPTPEEQPAVDFRVQGLHASAQHLGPAGEIGNVPYRDSRFAQQLGGSAGGENLDLQRCQALGKFHNPGLVKHTDKRALYHHVFLHNGKSTSVYGSRSNRGSTNAVGNAGRRLRFHESFQFDLASDHFHNVFNILAILLLLQLFRFF